MFFPLAYSKGQSQRNEPRQPITHSTGARVSLYVIVNLNLSALNARLVNSGVRLHTGVIMRKRDIVQEIISKRKRLGKRRDPASLVEVRAFGIFLALDKLRSMPAKDREDRALKQEMIRYLSVGIVSCLEGYYRLIIRRLIDHGSPYRENAVKLDDLRIDLPTITKMEAAKLTVGEIISHLVKLSSFDDINRHLSTLLATEYFAALRSMPIRNMEAFEKVHPRGWETLATVFQDRHVACHELIPRVPWTFKRAIDQWRVLLHVVEANEALLKKLKVKELR